MSTEVLMAAALKAIERYVDRQQTKLNENAAEAREAHIERLRRMALAGRHDYQVYPIAQLISATLDVSEATGVPVMTLPLETRQVLIAAHYAGMIQDYTVGLLQWDGPDFVSLNGQPEERSVDSEAFMAAQEYRAMQTIDELTGKI